jgi:hypothetical protein
MRIRRPLGGPVGAWPERPDVRSSYDRAVQLQQVVHRADQRPLLLHRPLTTPEELPEAAGVFDLSEDRLHNRLATRVHRPALQGPQLSRHPLTAGQPGGRSAPGRRRVPLGVLQPARRDVGVNLLGVQDAQRVVRTVARIRSTRRGRRRGVRVIAVTSGSRCPTSAAIGVTVWATITWAWPSTAAWAL